MEGELLSPYEGRRYGWGEESRKRMFIRNIQTGPRSMALYRRVAVLPCVEGQKYTLGNEFTGREEDGEFIWLPNTSAANEASICAITIEQSKYWVTPTSKTAVVLINGVMILTKKELEFGDTLLLADRSNTFLFKEREFNPGAFIYSATPIQKMTKEKAAERLAKIARPKVNKEFTPGQNVYILSRILSFLPVDDIKSCRAVAKLWNEEGIKLLQKKCTLALDFSSNYKDSYESMKLFRYAVEMKNSPLPNWRITIPGSIGSSYDMLNLDSGEPGAKLCEDFNWLLSGDNEKIRCVTRLKLGGRINSSSDYKLCHKVLQSLGKHLEELIMFGRWNLAVRWVEHYGLGKFNHFDKLRVLTLSMEEDDSLETDFSTFIWCQELIEAIEGVETLRFECPAAVALQFFQCLDGRQTLTSWFSKLSEITLHHTNSELIKILLEFFNPFKKLELNLLKNMKMQDYQDFGELLLKHADTLESFQVIIPTNDQLTPVFINFPTFPKLETLNIGWGLGSYRIHSDVKIMFASGTSYVNYDTDLPSLKSLTLWPTGFGKYHKNVDHSKYAYNSTVSDPKDYVSLCQMFFPAIVDNREVEICKTLQNLDILDRTCTFIGNRPLFPDDTGFIIAKMFPNVRNNAWLNFIRNRVEPEPMVVDLESSISPSRRQAGAGRGDWAVGMEFMDYCWDTNKKCSQDG